MRLKSFTVQGFKNLTGPAALGPLQPINVLHGANNAGKTNVLQALDVLFHLLRTGGQVTKDHVASLEAEAAPPGYPFEEILNRKSPGPIRWTVELSIDAAELEQAGIETNHNTDRVTICLELSPGLGNAQLRVLHFNIGEVDVALKDAERDSGIVRFAQQLRGHIARTYALETEKLGNTFVLLDVAARGPEEGGLVPQELRDALFDARLSLNRDDRQRWELFVRLARELEPELGPGRFDTAFDRASGRANLIYDTGEATLAMDSLGSGIQKFVALLASLVLSRAAFVGLPEPEIYLSYSLQQRLRRVLLAIAENGGPQQFFISSHSTALDDAQNSFVLELKEGVPTIEQRPWQDSAAPPPPRAEEPAPEVAQAVAPAEDDAAAIPAPATPDLDSLIGLVDQLAELDPTEIVAQDADAERPVAAAAAVSPRPAPAAAGRGPGNGQRVVDAAPWRVPGKK